MRAVGRGAVSSVAGLAIGGSGNVAVQPMPTASSLRTPQDVSVTIDDNAGRRAVRLGPTVYMPGGEISQYDGGAIVEVGFHVYPFYLDTTTTGGGSVANGLYAYKETYKWTNLQGDIDRSTTAIVLNSTMSGGPQSFSVVMVTTSFTKKSADYSAQYGSPFGTRSVTNITEELWRTLVNPLADSPFYLVTSQTPGTANPNKYQENVASAGANVGSQVVDGEADTTVGANQSNPENSLVLPNLAPPAASIIAATDLRIFLAGIAGDPDTVWYSKQRNTGEVAAFSDALTFSVPKAGGKITALSFLNETLVVFRERAIYAFAGDGFDNLGRGNNYGPARIVSLEVGAVNAESVALIAAGLMFKSSRGWFVLNRGWGIDYVGQGAAAYDSEVPVSVQVVGGQQQVRIATANRVLIYDTLQKLWGEWSISGVLDAVVWNGTYVYLTSAGVFQQAADFSGGTNYGMDVELAWLKPAGFTGRFDVRNIMPLGEFRSAFNLRLRVARNNLQDGSGNSAYFDDRIKTPETTVGSRMQVRHGPSIQSGFESIKVRLTATGTLATLAITSGGATVTFTSKRAGTLGNALSLAHTLTSQAVPSVADSGGNTITLSGLATLTFQQVVDATNLGSQLVSAALTAGSGATSFALTAFTGSPTGGVDWPTGEAMRLTAVGFEVQGGEGMFGLLPQAQTG
jgi:hypothetical protein